MPKQITNEVINQCQNKELIKKYVNAKTKYLIYRKVNAETKN